MEVMRCLWRSQSGLVQSCWEDSCATAVALLRCGALRVTLSYQTVQLVLTKKVQNLKWRSSIDILSPDPSPDSSPDSSSRCSDIPPFGRYSRRERSPRQDRYSVLPKPHASPSSATPRTPYPQSGRCTGLSCDGLDSQAEESQYPQHQRAGCLQTPWPRRTMTSCLR